MDRCFAGVRASVGAAITAKESESDKLNQANLSTIMNYGENFMEVLCRDACDGHHVGRVGRIHGGSVSRRV